MDIEYKLYPYPVLWEANDDYKSSKFDCKISITQGIRRLILDIDFTLTNKEMKELIKNGKAEFVLHIECPSTSYRNIVKTDLSTSTVELDAKNLKDTIALCPFVIVKEDIADWVNSNWNDDYAGISFDYVKGGILAIGERQTFDVEKEAEELGNLPSIFTIGKLSIMEPVPVKIEYGGDKIIISISEGDYEKYEGFTRYGNIDTINIANGTLISFALLSVIYELKMNFTVYEDCRWFRAIKAMMKKNDIEFDQQYIDNINPVELAQQLMDNPISKALEGTKAIMINGVDEE